MMKLTTLPVNELLAKFRSAEPVPGGGSAAALAGAVAASLFAMVAGLPKSQADTDAHRWDLASARDHCTGLATQLEALIDQDSAAYSLVVGAFRLPKSTDDEKAARSAAIQKAMIAATEAPLEVMRRCAETMAYAPIVRRLGNQNASSDAAVGEELLRAALRGARQNVEVNLASVKDAAYVQHVRDEMARLDATASAPAD
jgi:formiminotetrahydrofolate cyclodeaminase